jgi:hypothetical protein
MLELIDFSFSYELFATSDRNHNLSEEIWKRKKIHSIELLFSIRFQIVFGLMFITILLFNL